MVWGRSPREALTGLSSFTSWGFDQACFLTKAHSTGFPKFFLKLSVKILWASRNSGVEKDKRGSSCFLRSSSCCEKTEGQTARRSNAVVSKQTNKKKGESRPTFLTWRRISSRRDICSLSFLSTLDSYSACGGETKARQLQRKKKTTQTREKRKESSKRALFFFGFRLFSSATYELVHIVLSELRHRRSASLRPRLLSFSLSLSLSLASRARFCSFRHAPPLSFPFLDEAFRSRVDRFFLHCEFGERQ